MPLLDLIQRSRVLTLALSLLLVLAVGFLDLITGRDLSFSLFYMVPIALATLRAGRWAGIAFSLAGALVWGMADLWYVDYPHPLLPLWNSLVRLTFFLICTMFLAGLKERRRLELERALADRAAAEQRRIGQELHDTVMQQVLGTRMLAGSLLAKLKASGAPEAALAAELASQLGEAVLQLRRLMGGLVAVQVGPGELIPALERVARNFRTWHGLNVQLAYDRPVAVRDGRTARHLVLLAQEALMNVVKHAQASTALVSLDADEHELVLKVSDDGVGLPENHRRLGGLGLQSMRHRAEVIGAVLHVSRGHPRGTVVSCILSGRAPKRSAPHKVVGRRGLKPLMTRREKDA